MPFGKHKGKELQDIPKEYLHWLLDNVDLFDKLREDIQKELRTRASGEPTQNIKLTFGEITTVYKKMAKTWHPDVSGNGPKPMQAVNDFYSLIKEIISRRQ